MADYLCKVGQTMNNMKMVESNKHDCEVIHYTMMGCNVNCSKSSYTLFPSVSSKYAIYSSINTVYPDTYSLYSHLIIFPIIHSLKTA